MSLCLAAHAQLVVPPVTANCATSIDGTVVGTLNPLNPPQGSVGFSGTLAAGNYFIEIAWYDSLGHLTLPSPEIVEQLISTGSLIIQLPTSGIPANAVGMNVYIGTSSGAETLQGQTVSNATFTQSSALVSGAALPTTNNTVCSVIANDAGWPTGTGYNFSLTTPGGNTLPGYPLQTQFLGPGNTINLSAGLPLYNGVVTYPVPILARPYGHGPQSISGPLSLSGYNLTQVGRLGVGTSVPGWGVDAEGAGINGAVNANTGYLYNGAAPNNHVLLGNGSYYVDSATLPCSLITGAVCSSNAFYQTVASNGSAATQRPTLNFSTLFTVSDSASPAETNVTLSNTGVAANTYTYPSSVTVNATGQITAITGSSLGNYVVGASAGKRVMGGSTGTCSTTFSVTFTPAFTATPDSCQATGVGGSVNVSTCTSSGMTGNCSGVSNVYWMALGAN